MIRRICKDDLSECVTVITESFMTVADAFGFTIDNAPRFTAFATTEERLLQQLEQEDRQMFGYFENNRFVGYYSLLLQNAHACELNNLCVLEDYRHRKIGEALFQHACQQAKRLGCVQMNFSIVEENIKLRRWYELHGAEHVGTKKFEFFPFTCGYMEKML